MRDRGDRALAVAAGLAGANALACETVWTRLLGLALGHEQLGVLAVLAGFFAGLAVGAWSTHTWADALVRPVRVFAGLQVGAGIYAIASPWLLTWFAGWWPTVTGVEPAWVWSLLAAALVLLPATAAIGASLPILIAARRRLATDDARGLARLYSWDTVGATLGVLVSVHVLLPRLGIPLAAAVAAALGLAAAGAALWVADRTDAAESPPAPALEQPEQPPTHPAHPAVTASDDPDDRLLHERWILYVAFASLGLLGLGLQVVGVRVLAQIFSGTIYSFADLLAVWLLGTAVGAGAHARLSGHALGHRPATVLVGLLWALALTVAGSAIVAGAAPELLDTLAPTTRWARRQAAELAIAALVLGPATVLIGACFAHTLALIAAPSPGTREPRPIGAALAVNALASAAAPFVFGLLVIGSRGYAEAWSLIAWGYLLLGLAIAWLRRFPPRSLAFASVVGAVVLLGSGAGAGSLVLVDDEAEGWTVLEQVEAPLGVVAVSETTAWPGSPERPLRRLRIDRHFRMGGALSIGERRMGHVPMLLADVQPGDAALFLGLGTGATAGAGLGYPLGSLTAVELVPEVIDMLPYFTSINAGIGEDPRARIVAADARRFLRADPSRYRVIVADLFHPARDGAGSLYAREHFVAARAHLEPDGVFVQWLPLYQLDHATLAMIVATFTGVFDHTHAILALYNAETPALGLIGTVSPLTIELAAIERSLARPELAGSYTELALLDPRDLLAGYLLDRAGLLALADGAATHDDLHPRVDLWAPKATITGTTGADNLAWLLDRRVAWPESLVVDPDPERLAAYRAASLGFGDALDHYLRAEIALREGAGLTVAIVDHWLAAYVREPEFLPVRPRLFAAIQADPRWAARLLPSMLERTPDEPRVVQAWRAWQRRLDGTQPR